LNVYIEREGEWRGIASGEEVRSGEWESWENQQGFDWRRNK